MKLVFCSLLVLASVARAGSLTSACGVANGGPGDTDSAFNGQIALTCTLANASFSGVVREVRNDTLNYILSIQGVFLGSGSFAIEGEFTLFGMGDFYPYISFGGTLTGPGAVTATDAIRLGGLATAVPAPPLGWPLPAPMGVSIGNIYPLPFNGLTQFQTTVEWNAGGPGRAIDYSSTGGLILQYSTDPNRVIPEPATGGVLAASLLALLTWLRCRPH